MASPALRAAATALLLLSTVACTSYVHYPVGARQIPDADLPPIAVFEYSESADGLSLGETADRRPGYSTHRFTMPASFENGQPGNRLTGTYYASLSAGHVPLVIVLPVWGVSEYPSVKMTRTLLNRSRGRMNVLLVDGPYRLMPWERIEKSGSLSEFIAGLSNAAKRLKHAVIDTRRLIDWAETRPEIDANRIGLVGFSISAVTGTLVAQSDRRVRSSALVMGGAEIAKIVSNCPGNEKRTREAIMKKLRLGLAEYEEVISGIFQKLDPAHYPNRVNPRSVLIVDAGKDDCIPKASRLAWWEVLGRPERISMNYSHRGSFLAMTPLGLNLLRKRVYEHLEKTL